jgi:hypothetical protein
MDILTIPAHFDGQTIRLDEPVDLEPNAKLLVTVIKEADSDLESEREEWFRFADYSFGQLYENEPDLYTLDMIKVPNPEYRATR